MELYLNHRPLRLSDSIPHGLEHYYLPGADWQAWEGPAAFISVQSVQLSALRFKYLIYTPNTDQTLALRLTDGDFKVMISLRGQWNIKTCKGESSQMNTHESGILWGSSVELQTSVKEGLDLLLLSISYPTADAFQWIQYENRHKQEGQFDVKPVSLVTSDLIDQLLHSSFYPVPRPFQSRLCWDILREVYQTWQKGTRLSFSGDVHLIEQVHQVKMYIDTHPCQHLSIHALAGMVGVNRQKLQEGFRQRFGLGIYAYDFQNRMAIARHLLENTGHSIKQIAHRCRYKNASGFIAAFTKYAGLSPSQYRLQNA